MAWTLTPTHPISSTGRQPRAPSTRPSSPVSTEQRLPHGALGRPDLGSATASAAAAPRPTIIWRTSAKSAAVDLCLSTSRFAIPNGPLEPIASGTDGHVTALKTRHVLPDAAQNRTRSAPETVRNSLSRTVDAERVSFLPETEQVSGARGPRGRLGYALQPVQTAIHSSWVWVHGADVSRVRAARSHGPGAG